MMSNMKRPDICVYVCVLYMLWFLIEFIFFLEGEGDAKTASCHTEAPGRYFTYKSHFYAVLKLNVLMMVSN